MPKLSNKELEKRKLEMAARSREAIAKKELVQFRMEPEKIVKLFELAAKKGTHVSAMLRQWADERLAQEGSPFGLAKQSSMVKETEAHYEPAKKVAEQIRRIEDLERRVQILEEKKQRAAYQKHKDKKNV